MTRKIQALLAALLIGAALSAPAKADATAAASATVSTACDTQTWPLTTAQGSQFYATLNVLRTGEVCVTLTASGAPVTPANPLPVIDASPIPTQQSGVAAPVIGCDQHGFKHITTATDTLAVQGVAAKAIYICGWKERAAGTATWFFEDTASTNANCGSTLTQITGLVSEVANGGEAVMSPFWTGLKNTVAHGLCINSTGTGGLDIDFWYTIQ